MRQLIDGYLQSSNLTRLSDSILQELEAPITEEEVRIALKETHSGKAPDPDGLTAPYNKALESVLVLQFVSAFNSIDGMSGFGRDTLRVQITVIPKAGKDPAECQSYRPISLLNMDLKLFTSVLAFRLEPEFPSVVHYYQVGFVATREVRDSVPRVLDLLYEAKVHSLPLMLLCIDAG